MCWPTFLIIGASKCGTTSLYHYLGQHPDVFMSPVKEPNYFAFPYAPPRFQGPGDAERINRRTVWREADYTALFAAGAGRTAQGEASHWYLYHPDAASHLADRLPAVRLVAILRDPAERAYASYWHMRRHGRERLPSFIDALRAEPDRIAAGWAWGRYVDRGLYAAQLARYYERFPPEQIRVCFFEHLRTQADALLGDLCRFVGVRDDFAFDLRTRYNASGRARFAPLGWALQVASRVAPDLRRALPASTVDAIRRRKVQVQAWNTTRPPLPAEARAYLRALQRDDTLRLQDMLGCDLSAWLR